VLNPDVLSGGDWCLFCHSRLFKATHFTPLIAINRSPAPFSKVTWKAIKEKCRFQGAAPIHLWAAERSRIVDSASQDVSWGSGKWHASDVPCPSQKSTIIISVKGLNRKAFKEAGRLKHGGPCCERSVDVVASVPIKIVLKYEL
jgi:hypothetical protein